MGKEIVDHFNKEVGEALSHVQFEIHENHLQQTWDRSRINLFEPLWILIKSAQDVLHQEDYHRMKECGACGWIFLDQTKNNQRRWCNPSTCGSIEKSKRYYRKKKKEG